MKSKNQYIKSFLLFDLQKEVTWFNMKIINCLKKISDSNKSLIYNAYRSQKNNSCTKKKNPNSFKTQYLKSMEGKINHKKGGGYHPMQHTQGSYITAT